MLNRSYEAGVGFAGPCFAYVLLRKVQSMHETFEEARTVVLVGPDKRDLRLDLLRGIGQWMVFLDHIPYNFLNWFTLRNYGFSDAAEIFVFISGYSIGFAYGPAVKGWPVCSCGQAPLDARIATLRRPYFFISILHSSDCSHRCSV